VTHAPREPLGLAEKARLVDVLGHAVVALDENGLVAYWNKAAENLFGWPSLEAMGREVFDLAIPFFNVDRAEEILGELYAGRGWTGAFTFQRKDGAAFTAVVDGQPILDTGGTLVGVVGVITNLGPLLQPFLSQSQEAAVVTDAGGRILFASPAVRSVVGWTSETLAGDTMQSLAHPDDRQQVEDYLLAFSSATERLAPLEFRAQAPYGSELWLQAVLTDLLSDPSVRGIVWTLRDTSDRHADLERLAEVAMHDPLTGLPNRVLLADRVALATSRRDAHGAVLFIDLDDFKQVNDSLGHAAGDVLLQAVASRLVHAIRPEDTCGRWSGDEFLVLNESVHDLDEAVALAERMSRVIEEPVRIAGKDVRVAVSIGVALIDDANDPAQLLQVADERMYEEKRRHRAAKAAPPG
jgi:diguanylate cyclase (GGDEF)-like protein/PAS domain S-box-containing protein